MSRLDNTLASMAPGVSLSQDLAGRYNPRRGLAIYCLPIPGYSPSAPGVVLGEALAARSGLGCTLLEGVPAKIPEGAVVVGQYNDLKTLRPDLMGDVPDLREPSQYAIALGRHALVTSPAREGLASGMQTLAMLVLRHNEDTIPGSLILDSPACQARGLAVELKTSEIGINLLMQIASFAATFKANRLHLILDDEFDPGRDIPGVDAFIQTCQSYGIAVGVRLPWLAGIISGERTLVDAWLGLRAAARVFGAELAALDDPCPTDADQKDVRRVAASLVRGEAGFKNFSVDVNLLLRSEIPSAEFKAAGIVGWYRLWGDDVEPAANLAEFPLFLDVESPVPGFSGRTMDAFYKRLDVATGWLRRRRRREICVSFRNIGVSHMWQNLLFPAATGLIAAWGNPLGAEQASRLFANLLYGDSSEAVIQAWDAITAAFPPGLSRRDEMLVRRTAFGRWPESDGDLALLSGIDWMSVTKNIHAAADALRNAVESLSRNASTLTGAKLSLHALTWLHCFIALTPELERRRRAKYDDDGRTEPIAAELYNNFKAWHAGLQELFGESGLEISELGQIEAMGLRLKGLCDGIFEYR